MSENCDHNCSGCSQSDCHDRDLHEKTHAKSHIKKVIGVVSGKGGVGKSIVSSMLAVLAQRKGLKTAVLDADVTGPSIPKAFGVSQRISGSDEGMIPSKSKKGTEIMSLNLLLENDTDPVVWRGPMVSNTIKQFWTDVIWGDIDVMFIDMPPGTGDVALTVFQSIPIDGIIIVSSPQELVGMIVEKAVKMAAMMKIPVLGLVENMSFVECPKCKEIIRPFGESHIDEIAKSHKVDTFASLPIDPKLASACDMGNIEEFDGKWLDGVIDMITALPSNEKA